MFDYQDIISSINVNLINEHVASSLEHTLYNKLIHDFLGNSTDPNNGAPVFYSDSHHAEIHSHNTMAVAGTPYSLRYSINKEAFRSDVIYDVSGTVITVEEQHAINVNSLSFINAGGATTLPIISKTRPLWYVNYQAFVFVKNGDHFEAPFYETNVGFKVIEISKYFAGPFEVWLDGTKVYLKFDPSWNPSENILWARVKIVKYLG